MSHTRAHDVAVPIIPAPPRPPLTYSQSFGNEMNRWLQNLANAVTGIFYLRGNSLYLAPESMPTSGYGLRPGEVFANAGILTMVREDDIWIGSVHAEGSVGTITVTV